MKLFIILITSLIVLLLLFLVILPLTAHWPFKMGNKEHFKEDTLIKTLEYIAQILNKSDLQWTIAYGTLLGLIIDKNPPKNDNDIDILIPSEQEKSLTDLLKKNNFNYTKRWYGIGNLKHKIKKGLGPIDFHFFKKCSKNGYDIYIIADNFPVKLFPIKKIKWNGLKINIPNNSIKFLKERYGQWKIPSNIHSDHVKNHPVCLPQKIYEKQVEIYKKKIPWTG